jgi:hypothetical protein
MGFDLKDVLTTVGPTTGLIFASWLFLQYLNQRYVSAHDRYRALIAEYRQGDGQNPRRHSLMDQIRLYRRRCDEMRWATNIGLLAAMLLIVGLLAAFLQLVSKSLDFLKFVSVGASVLGLLLVIGAAALVMVENMLLKRAIESDSSDIPELFEQPVPSPAGRSRAPRPV